MGGYYRGTCSFFSLGLSGGHWCRGRREQGSPLQEAGGNDGSVNALPLVMMLLLMALDIELILIVILRNVIVIVVLVVG